MNIYIYLNIHIYIICIHVYTHLCRIYLIHKYIHSSICIYTYTYCILSIYTLYVQGFIDIYMCTATCDIVSHIYIYM